MAKAAAEAGQVAARIGPLDGRSVAAEGVSVTVLAPASRISLRAPQGSLPALGKALGVSLPRKPKKATEAGGRAALWFGPDEWLVIDMDGKDPVADCVSVSALHSAVDVSHRNVGLMVEGPLAEAVLSAGCPQDLSRPAFGVGACSRTVFGSAEVVIWRRSETAFHVECWRSFGDYVLTFMETAARDAAG
ncbi:MAG: sarcosine oxidase subunit gamma [Rhizobiaceae bacterium]|nr:sarcosine oxidase subunit gamma [Rhizobiaceae bacterium]MCV0408455.1 sarcosine oxidase subunit gamma [Rhizobiaceae bacterium]